MIVFLALAAAIQTPAELRAQALQGAWQECVAQNAVPLKQFNSEISSEDRIKIAKTHCLELKRDYSDALFKFAPEILKKQGLLHFSADVVELLVESSIKVVEDRIDARATTFFAEKAGS